MEKYIRCKWEAKESCSSKPYIRQNRPKIKKIIRDKEGHYITIKGSVQEEDITIASIYSPNIGAPQYIKRTLTDIKREVDSNKIIVGGFTTPVTLKDRSSNRKLIRKHKP